MTSEAKKYHQVLAEYFNTQSLFLESLKFQQERSKSSSPLPRIINIRKVVELPWQRQQAKQWTELSDILGNLAYLELIWQQNQEDVLRYWHSVESQSNYSMPKVYTPEHCDPIKYGGQAWIPARLLLDTGKLNEAATLWKLIVEECRRSNDPELDGALANLGIALEILRDFDGAMKCYNEQRQISESRQDLFGLQAAFGNMGNVAFEQGDLDRALKLHKAQEEICRTFHYDADLHRSLGNQGNIYATKGDLDTALKLFREQEEICGRIGDHRSMHIAILNQANIAFQTKDFINAEFLVKKAITEFRELGAKEYLWGALALLGHIYTWQGSPELSKPLYDEAELICHKLGTAYNLAHMFYKQGLMALKTFEKARRPVTKVFQGLENYEKYLTIQDRTVDYLNVSVAAFRKALALQSEWAEASFLLGQAFELQRHQLDAISSYETALAIRSDWPELNMRLGSLLVKQRSTPAMIDRGIQLLRKAASSDGDVPQIYIELMIAWFQKDQPNEAISEFISFVKNHPIATQVHHDMILTLVRTYGLANAFFQGFQRIILDKPKAEFFLIHYSFGLLYASLGMHDDAIVVYQEAIRSNPEFGPAYHNLGLSYYYSCTLVSESEKTFRTKHAIENCKTATLKNPQLAEPHYFLGVMKMGDGNYGLALTHFIEFVRLASSNQYLASYVAQAKQSIQLLKEKLGMKSG